HLIRGADALAALDPGGLEVLEADVPRFRAALTRENHTLKRALTDPRLLAGIGNAYPDEILHRARLSPVKLTRQLGDDEIARLHAATRATLHEWTARLRAEAGDGFPEKVTAFRDGMAVHGRYRKPCPDCGSPVQRTVYAESETTCCARCQTGGGRLAARSLSRVRQSDWPRSVERLETSGGAAGEGGEEAARGLRVPGDCGRIGGSRGRDLDLVGEPVGGALAPPREMPRRGERACAGQERQTLGDQGQPHAARVRHLVAVP